MSFPLAIRSMAAAAAALAFLVLAAPAVAAPGVRLGVAFAPGSPAPPVPHMEYRYGLDVGNAGDVPLDELVVIDTVPFEMTVLGATTGSYTGLGDIAAGEGVRVSYEKNTAPGVFTLWGSSPNTSTNTTLTAPPPGLGAGEYITRVRWEFGQAAAGMTPSVAPTIAGLIQNPDHAGGWTLIGDPIENCATVTGRWTAGPEDVDATSCLKFDLPDAPTVTIDAPDSTPLGTASHATATLTGGDPRSTISMRVYRADDRRCSHPIFVDDVALHGVGSYGADFTASEAGAFRWVAVYSGEIGHGGANSGCANPAGDFTVVAPPVVSASFGDPEITAGQPTRLTYTITNPAANTVALTGVGLEAELPAGLAVATPNGASGDCGGAIAAAPGSHRVTLTGGTIAVAGTCSFDVRVTAATAGALTATTEPVGSANGGPGNAATASLIVRAPARAIPTPPRRPVLPRVLTARELTVSCSPDRLVLSSVRVAGRHVRFEGLAAAADAGRQLLIRALPTGAVAARATVLPGGSFAGTAPLPRRRAVHKTRYVAELGQRRSADLKLTRRLSARLTAGAVLRGRVAPPLDTPAGPVVVRRLTSCAGGYEVVARVKPGARGRFRVALPATPGPALYLVQTQVRTKVGGAIQTFSLVLASES